MNEWSCEHVCSVGEKGAQRARWNLVVKLVCQVSIIHIPHKPLILTGQCPFSHSFIQLGSIQPASTRPNFPINGNDIRDKTSNKSLSWLHTRAHRIQCYDLLLNTYCFGLWSVHLALSFTAMAAQHPWLEVNVASS